MTVERRTVVKRSSTWWLPAVSGGLCPSVTRTGTPCTATTLAGHATAPGPRLGRAVCERECRDAEPSAGIVDPRTVRGATTVCGDTKGYDAGKKISGRKTFGIVDTLGLLLAVTVVAANTSGNTGGVGVADAARARSTRFRRLGATPG